MCPLHLLRYLKSSTKLLILDSHNLCSLLFFKFYSGGPTDDLRCGLLYLSQKYPNAPLVGLGFSLGANILTRYLGEEGTRSRLIAGIALACVSTSPNHSKDTNADEGTLSLHSALGRPEEHGTVSVLCGAMVKQETPPLTESAFPIFSLNTDFIHRNLYSKALGANLVALFKHHRQSSHHDNYLPRSNHNLCSSIVKSLRSFPPDDRMTPIIEPVLAMKNPTFQEVDAILTRTVGGPRPIFPLPTALAYCTSPSAPPFHS